MEDCMVGAGLENENDNFNEYLHYEIYDASDFK